MGKTSIEWTDRTWNPLRGCQRVSEGCRNCYAERIAARFSGAGQPFYGIAERTPHYRWTGASALVESLIDEPTRWRPSRVFVNSMSDVFYEGFSDETIERVWVTMARAHWHTFQILTKRPSRMQSLLSRGKLRSLPNVWLGVSVENQNAVQRVGTLLATPAAVRFVSAEPLIGPVSISSSLLSSIDWLIVGGESGPNARPMHPDWARSLRDQCSRAGVPFFFKQWGAWREWASAPTEPSNNRRDLLLSLDGHTTSAKTRTRPHGFDTIVTPNRWRADRTLDGREWNDFPRMAS